MMFRSSFFSCNNSDLYPIQTILRKEKSDSVNSPQVMSAYSSNEPTGPLTVNIRHIRMASAILGNVAVAPLVVGAGYPLQRLTVAFQSGELTSIVKNITVIKHGFPSHSLKATLPRWYFQGVLPFLKNAPISKGSFMGPVFVVNAWKGSPEDDEYQWRNKLALPIACVASSVSQAAVQFPARIKQLNQITNASKATCHKQYLKPNNFTRLYIP